MCVPKCGGVFFLGTVGVGQRTIDLWFCIYDDLMKEIIKLVTKLTE